MNLKQENRGRGHRWNKKLIFWKGGRKGEDTMTNARENPEGSSALSSYSA
jgi:hypothetical protein